MGRRDYSATRTGTTWTSRRNVYSYRNLFHGQARGYFQSTGDAGPIELPAAAILGDRLFENQIPVTLATARIALRGELPQATFDIRYTTDGSEPKSASARYTEPLILTSATLVRMLVHCDGQEVFNATLPTGTARP